MQRSLGANGRSGHSGRFERGFDFLDYHFSPAWLTVAAKTIANFIEKASRLYEQKRSAVWAATALKMYVRQWLWWAGNALCETVVRVGKQSMGMGCSPLYFTVYVAGG